MKNLNFSNGDRMPALGLGTWKAESGVVYDAVREAIRMGYRHIDCAAIYGNEAEIGQALSDARSAGEVRREELWITSKLWNNAHKEADVRPALEQTLRDLQLDSLDLYLIHWPVVFKPGVVFPESDDEYLTLEEVPIIETWRAMEQCADAGLAGHVGVSNFSARKLEGLLPECRIRPEMNQVEMHPRLQQEELKAFCDANGIFLTAYSPLGSRDRPESFKREEEPDLLKLEVIQDIAADHKVEPAQILLAWAVNRGTAVIPKSVTPRRLRQNLEAADIELSREEMARIAELDRHFRFITGSVWKGPYNVHNLWDE